MNFNEIKEQVVNGFANKHMIPGLLEASRSDEDIVLHNIYEFDRIHNQVQGSNTSNSYRAVSRGIYRFLVQ